MKVYYWILILLGCCLAGCSGTTYSKQIEAENKLVDNYISRMGICVLDEAPSLSQGERWGEWDYIEVEGYEGLYFHLCSPIDTTLPTLVTGDKVNVRYRRYGLDEYTDTVSCWTTDDSGEPEVITLGDNTTTTTCIGWHVAILKMGYSGCECRIICPSRYGFSSDNSNVVPRVYDLRATKR